MARAEDPPGAGRPGMTWLQTLALLLGVGCLLLGVLGLLPLGRADSRGAGLLPALVVGPWHSGVFLAVGLAGILLARTVAGVRGFGWVLAVVATLLFGYGQFALGQPWDLLRLTPADDVLHLLGGVAGAVLLLGPVRRTPGRRRGH